MARIVIFGAGDIARLAHFYFTRDTAHEVVAFAVDPGFRTADQLLDLPVLEIDEVRRRHPPSECRMFVALAYGRMNHDRAAKYQHAKELGYELVTYVSSRCTYLSDRPPGDNCFILEDNTIQPYVTIGNDVTLWSGNHVGHDSVVEDHCFISSHVVISGHVHVQPYCFIGVNATIRNDVTLAAETLVGAGSIIMKDTKPQSVYVPERTAVFPKKSDQVKL